MVDYLFRYPLVLAALVSALAAIVCMFVASVLSFRFLRLLRRQASDFWNAKMGCSIGTARFFEILPGSVSKMSNDPVVLGLCRRFAKPLLITRSVAIALAIIAAALLIASGLRS